MQVHRVVLCLILLPIHLNNLLFSLTRNVLINFTEPPFHVSLELKLCERFEAPGQAVFSGMCFESGFGLRTDVDELWM